MLDVVGHRTSQLQEVGGGRVMERPAGAGGPLTQEGLHLGGGDRPQGKPLGHPEQRGLIVDHQLLHEMPFGAGQDQTDPGVGVGQGFEQAGKGKSPYRVMAWNSSRTKTAGRLAASSASRPYTSARTVSASRAVMAGIKPEPWVAGRIEGDDRVDPDPAKEFRHGLAGPMPAGAGQVEGTGGDGLARPARLVARRTLTSMVAAGGRAWANGAFCPVQQRGLAVASG